MYKLYVFNLPLDASEDALRKHFAVHGGVSDVELFVDRSTGKSNGNGCVTMTSSFYFDIALREGERAPFGGQRIRVSERARPPRAVVGSTTKIVTQFRERTNMTYDLDCAGMPLTLRIFPLDGERWRVDASSKTFADTVATGSGSTRRAALTETITRWNDGAFAAGLDLLDGQEVETALRAVRAV